MEYIADKLVHPSAQTRGRALESLDFKWKYGLVGAADLLQDRKVLKGLLGLLNIGDGVQTTAVALLLLRKITAADTRLAKALLELGALQQLHAFTSKSSATASPHKATAAGTAATAAPKFFITPGVWPDELLPSVEALVSLLLSPVAPGSAASSSSSPETAHVRASSATSRLSQQYSPAAAAGTVRGSRSNLHPAGQHQELPQEDIARRTESSSTALGRRHQQAAAGAASSGPVHPVFGRLQGLSAAAAAAAAADRPGSSACSIAPPSTASTASPRSGSAAAHETSAAGHTRPRDSVSRSGFSAAAAAAASDQCSSAAAAGRAPADDADTGDTSRFDERLIRARARADWRQHEQGTGGVEGPGSLLLLSPTLKSASGHLTLPVVVLSAADDQALFELNVRLQYSDDERLLLPALLELGGVVGLDLPAEALLQRQSILDNCLALLSSSRYSKAVHQAAAAVLLQLITGLKSSLALAQHPELAHSEYGDSIIRDTAAAAAGVPSSSALASLGTADNSSSSMLVAAKLVPAFGAAARALAAAKAPVLDPTCPNSYPQLPQPQSGPDTPWQLPLTVVEDQWVDITAAVNSICLQVMDLLSHPDRHYELLPLTEAALPLLTAPIAELSNSSSASQQQQEQQLHEELQALWRGLLGALSRALASTAAVAAGDRAAAVAASLSGQQEAAGHITVLAAAGGGAAPGIGAVGVCCWDLLSINLLTLALRLLQSAPASWCTSAVVPPSLADALASAACDGALALLFPELRSIAQVLLHQLRPASLAALQAAEAVKAALVAAEEAAGPMLLQLQQQGPEVAFKWLERVQAALPGLGYNPRIDARLLQSFLQGLAAVAASSRPHSTDGNVSGDRCDVQVSADKLLVLLLSHQQQQVQDMMLQLLVSATQQQQQQPSAFSNQLDAVQQLLMSPHVTEHLIVQGLANPQTQAVVSNILLGILTHQGYRAASWLMPWRCWISCWADNTQGSEAAALAEGLEAYRQEGLAQQQQQGLDEFGGLSFWESPAVAVLQDLFCVSSERRRAAGRQLLQLLVGEEEAGVEDDGGDEYADDPFRGLLDSHTLSSSSSNRPSQQQQHHHHLPPDPLTDSSTALAANFTPQDVRNLLGVLGNQGLAQELRRAAADEMLALSPVPQLLEVMVQNETLEKIWQLCVPTWDGELPGTPGAAAAAADASVGAGAPSGGIFDMQLPVAALQLLAGLLARSPKALLWMAGEPHRLLVPLLPLVLHTLHSVRRAVARVLALVLFGSAANNWSGFSVAAAVAAGRADGEVGQQQQETGDGAALLPAGVRAVLLPEPFLQQYKFPFRVLAVPVTAAAAGGVVEDEWSTAEAANGELTPGQEHNHQQQQQYIVKQLVEQQQLLAAANFSPVIARQLLQDCLPPHLQHISQRVLSATANQLFNCDPSAVGQRVLAAVAAAGSHAECGQALRQLERLGSSQRGLQAIAAAGSTTTAAAGGDGASSSEHGISWQSAFERLLGTAPVTADDQKLWCQLLQLVDRMLTAAPLTQVQYTYLQVLLQRSLTTWLQQPSTAGEVPRPPLALAAGTNSWQLLKQQPTSVAAAAAVADMLGVTAAGSSSSGVAAAAAGVGTSDEGLLALQVSRQALRVLLQLITSVKTYCCISDSNSSSSSSSVNSCYSLAALQPAGLVHLLSSSLVGCSDGIDYGCRVLAAAVLAETAGALQDVAQVQTLTKKSTTTTSSSSSGVFTDAASAFLDAVEPLITRVLMPVAGKQLPGFRGKCLVMNVLQVLLHVVEGPLVLAEDWSQVWAAIGGTFWISRLSRDREARIRCLALSLLFHLLSLAASATQALIAHNWPDCVNRLLRVSADACESYAVRTAAIRALTAAMVVPVEILQSFQQQQEDGQHQQQPKKLHSFGLGPILQLDQLWGELVPQLLLTWQQQPAGLTAAAAALASAGMAAEPDVVGRRLLLQPGLAAAVLELVQTCSSVGQQQQLPYVQQLQKLGAMHEPTSPSSRLLAAPCGLAAAAAQQEASPSAATLQVQPQAEALSAVAAAAQLLALAAAPASGGGGLLLLPAAVQDVLVQAPAVMIRTLCRVGNNLVDLTSSSSSGSSSLGVSSQHGAAAGAVMSLLQQQLSTLQMAVGAVLSSPLGPLPEEQRQQQLLQLVLQACQQTQQQQQQPGTPQQSSSSSQALLTAISSGLSHPASTPGLKLLLAQLLGLVMSDAAAAAAALGVDGSSSSSSADDLVVAAVAGACADKRAELASVGAALCRELASLLPASIFTPAAAATAADPTAAAGDQLASSSSATAPTVASPEGLVIVFALQNLLTYSKAAKTTAIDLGLHKLFMETARAMAAAVTAAAPASGQGSSSVAAAAAAMGATGGASKTRARWFSYKPAAAAVTKKPAAVAFGRGGSNSSAAADDAQAGGKAMSQPAAAGPKRATGPKKAGSLRPSRRQQQLTPKQQQQQQQQEDADTAIDTAAAAADAEAAVLREDNLIPAAADVPGDEALAAAAGDAQAVLSGSSKQQQVAAVKAVNQRKLLLSLVLLRHLAYGCHDTQAALVGDGLVDVVLQLWPQALTHIPLLLELLQVLGNILPHCYQARLAAASLGQPQSTLLQHLLLLLLLPAAPQPQPAGSSSSSGLAAAAAGHVEVVKGATAVLLGYASTDDGACQLVKAGNSFLSDSQKIVRWCLISLRKEQERQQQRQVQQHRLRGVLQLLTVIAGRLEGQRALLKPTTAPALVDLVVEVLLLLPQQGAAATAAPALLLLRNLSFHADLRSPALANQQLLPLLLAAAESLQPVEQQQQDQGSITRPCGSVSSSSLTVGDTAVPQWAPLYGKPVASSAAAASGSALSRVAAAGSSGSNSRPGSPVVISAGSGCAATAVAGALGNVCCAVYAVSALWALMYQGEKIKAAVRKIPRAAARLAAVNDQAQQLLQQASSSAAAGRCSSSKDSHQRPSGPVRDVSKVSDTPEKIKRAATAAAAASAASMGQQQSKGYSQSQQQQQQKFVQGVLNVAGGVGVSVDPGSLCGSRVVQWWLKQLVKSSAAVMDIMESV